MISALIKTKIKDIKLGEGIWCIATLGAYYKEGAFFIITFDLESHKLTLEGVAEYIMDMETWGLPMIFTKQENNDLYNVSLDLNYYDSYTKLVTVLTLFRVIFNKYASTDIFINYQRLTPIFPELDSLQIHQLAVYKSSNIIDQLHSIVKNPRKLTTIDQFKKLFLISNKLHNMFDNQVIDHPHKLLKQPEENKQEILKIVL